MLKLEVTYRDPRSLRASSRKLKRRSSQTLKKLAESISLFDVLEPPLVTSDGEIVVGEGRIAAAIEAGYKSVPTICVDHLTPTEIRAYRIAANRLAELSTWDQEVLALEIAELDALEKNYDLSVIGFDEAAIEQFVRIHENHEILDDDVSSIARGPAVAQIGQLWLLGKHRLFVGDALDSASYHALMAGEQARMILSDVPFNLTIPGVVSGNGKVIHQNFSMASGEMSDAEFTRFLTRSMRLMSEHSVDGALAYVFIDFRSMLQLLRAGMIVFDELKAIITWDKGSGGMGSLYRSRSEFICIFKKGNAPHTNNIMLGKNGRNRTSVWEYSGLNSFQTDRSELLECHPTVKPVVLLHDAIIDVTRKNEIVLDPFVGSGSTILAAEQAKRRCFAMELSEAYSDVALRRFRKATGIDPVLSSTGQTLSDLEALAEACTKGLGR